MNGRVAEDVEVDPDVEPEVDVVEVDVVEVDPEEVDPEEVDVVWWPCLTGCVDPEVSVAPCQDRVASGIIRPASMDDASMRMESAF